MISIKQRFDDVLFQRSIPASLRLDTTLGQTVEIIQVKSLIFQCFNARDRLPVLADQYLLPALSGSDPGVLIESLGF
ncbi:hypothetical protein [Halomonas sp.]|uniref:hypothetical protein n=1 Tax=Halomonas sp. TaxID=1486246 RepID=UPI000C907163|nr:hypothetical protein [Halomonas sp.]MAR70995.1 hypothetical protein [Halomonas sp.]|tara:strand:+ start:458 stop:688 length:231 start_codon:yes stop_codon:yes gene_type:complete